MDHLFTLLAVVGYHAATLAVLFTDAQFAALMAFLSSTVAAVLTFMTRRDLNRYTKEMEPTVSDIQRKIGADRRAEDHAALGPEA